MNAWMNQKKQEIDELPMYNSDDFLSSDSGLYESESEKSVENPLNDAANQVINLSDNKTTSQNMEAPFRQPTQDQNSTKGK